MATQKWTGETSTAWDTATNWENDTLPSAGDDIEMKYDVVNWARFCTAGPAAATVWGSLTITLPADLAANPGILATGAIQTFSSLAISEDQTAGTPCPTGTVFGALTKVHLVTGAASIILQPATTGARTVYLCPSDAAANIVAESWSYSAPSDTGTIVVAVGTTSNSVGMVTLDQLVTDGNALNVTGTSIGTVTVNTTLATTLSTTIGKFVGSVPGILNVNAELVFTGTIYAGSTVNVADSFLIVSTSSAEICDTATINVNSGDLTLANFGCTTITVNANGHQVSQIDIAGTVTVNNAARITDLGPWPVGATSIGPYPVESVSVGPYPVT